MPTLTRQKPGPAMKAAPIEDGWPDDSGIKLMVYGVSGSGKTTFASSFPSPLCWLICSGPVKSGELRSVDTPENRKRIKPKKLLSSETLDEVFEEARAGAFKTLVLDHVSGLQDLIIKETAGMKEVPIAKYKIAGKGESWGLISKQQYGQASIRCKEALRDILNLPLNVVILGQERTTGGDEDLTSEIITPSVGVALMPSLAGWLNPAVDYIVQTYKRPRMKYTTGTVAGVEVTTASREKGVEYILRCEPHDVFTTKFRVPKGRPLRDLVDPDFDKLMAMINGIDEDGLDAES